MDTLHISIVSPVYRGEKMVAELVRRNVERCFAFLIDSLFLKRK